MGRFGTFFGNYGVVRPERGGSAPHPVQCAHWTTFPIPSVSLRSTSSLPPLAFGHFPLTGGIGPLIRGVGPPGGRLAARRVVAPYSNKGTRSGGAVRTPAPATDVKTARTKEYLREITEQGPNPCPRYPMSIFLSAPPVTRSPCFSLSHLSENRSPAGKYFVKKMLFWN